MVTSSILTRSMATARRVSNDRQRAVVRQRLKRIDTHGEEIGSIGNSQIEHGVAASSGAPRVSGVEHRETMLVEGIDEKPTNNIGKASVEGFSKLRVPCIEVSKQKQGGLLLSQTQDWLQDLSGDVSGEARFKIDGADIGSDAIQFDLHGGTHVPIHT